MSGWRTAVIQDKVKLTVRDRQLISEGQTETAVPLDQLRQVMIISDGSVLSASALLAAAQEHVHVVFCGSRHTPVCELIPLALHHEASGAVMDQAGWHESGKDIVWKVIVEMKLKNQSALLKLLQRDPPPRFAEYMRSVEPGDKTNREGLAARLYFPSLFGRDFRRHAKDHVNAKLNYGYTILCSCVSRVLGLHGYHTGLGIHHCSRDNPVNLSCDLREPFRPFVDKLVYESGEASLDWETRKQLIALPMEECFLDGKRMTLDTAVELFALDTLRAVKDGKESLPEVSLG